MSSVLLKKITSTDAQKKFAQMLDEASHGLATFVITKAGKQRAVVLSVDRYRELLEEEEILAEQRDPKFQRRLAEAKREYEVGEVLTEEEFDQEFGF